MSFRKEKYLKYQESNSVARLAYIDELSSNDIRDLFYEVLNDGINGFCYSMYEEGQKPGDIITKNQIQRRMRKLESHTQSIRSFSCTEGNELVPVVAKELGLNTLVGAWLGSDKEKNKEEINGLIKLAKEGFVDIAAVGNEVLYRDDLSEEELIEYISYVKDELPDIPVGYVDAYYEFVERPKITELCDVILCNCYPYWEGTSFKDSFQHMRQMFHQAKEASGGYKRVIITETGWPSQGETLGESVPGQVNAMKYFINANLWCHDEDIEIFYFSSFDESWKMNDEGEVGAYWGVWDKNGELKF
ncbi:MAG: glycosyl hydrolase family 17 protein [Balneola sp.]